MQARYAQMGEIERSILDEAHTILGSSDMAGLRTAATNGKAFEARVQGRMIVFEPAMPLPFYGMTLFEENGFVLGPAAFSSDEELQRTILQELYRLRTRQAAAGATAAQIGEQTTHASAFVGRTWPLLRWLIAGG